MSKALVVFAIGCLAFAAASIFKDCGTGGAKVNSVDISSCATENPCPLKKNTYVNVTVNFTADESIAKATNKVYGILGGVPIPFPGVEDDACPGMGGCPVHSGDQRSFHSSIFVKPDYPDVTVVVEWEIINSTEKVFLCFEIPAVITN